VRVWGGLAQLLREGIELWMGVGGRGWGLGRGPVHRAKLAGDP